LTFFESDGQPYNVCGDLEFDGRTRTFTATYTPNNDQKDDGPYRYWWRRGRFATIVDDTVDQPLPTDTGFQEFTRTLPMPLLDQYDGLGAILLLSKDGTLQPVLAPFMGVAVNDTTEANIWVQHWRRIDAPVLNSATLNGTQVLLQWSNFHNGRAIDGTVIFRNGAVIASVGPTTISYPDNLPGAGTYTYQLKHLTPDLTSALPEPNSAGSNTLQVTLNNPPITAYIDGPDVVEEKGTYSWTTVPSGGLGPPYHYQWYYKRSYGTWEYFEVIPNSDVATYQRYVGQEPDPYAFSLIVTVWDNYGTRADSADRLVVYVMPHGGWGPLSASAGLIGPDGRCRRIPAERAERQRLFRELWDARAPWVACTVRPSDTP
jgi:hypothetical protein